MNNTRKISINLLIIAFALIAAVFACTIAVNAASVPSATGLVNSSSGAVLRKSSSTGSAKLSTLADNTKLTIHKEVFKKKKSTSAKNRWYYVTANGIKGYIRADLVDNINYGSVNGSVTKKVNHRVGAGTKMKKKGSFKKGTGVTVVLEATPVKSTKGSSKTWYKVVNGSGFSYVCSSKVKLTSSAVAAAQPKTTSGSYSNYVSQPAANMNDEQFEKYMTSQGFPDSYKPMLRKLHKAHPNWGFVAYKTNIAWSTALSKQTSGGTSLVSKSYPSSYRSGSKQYESGWYKASSMVVAYYMDPRNFINEDGIYMFEDLSYKPAYQTASVVNAIISSTKLPTYGFTASVFVNAGALNNVSPVFLASRARQETGGNSDSVNGTKVLGKKVYNPFNIGAFGGTNPLYNGLIYAYGKGWTTPAKAVEGGSLELAKNYIHKGQYTGYYQRFNVRNGASKVGTHQYMTNIMAPYSEALATKKSYAKYGITNESITFEIPVYTGMPSSTKLP